MHVLSASRASSFISRGPFLPFHLPPPAHLQVEKLRVMLLGMINDPRVVLVKLADRLHNMRTMYDVVWLPHRVEQDGVRVSDTLDHRTTAP